MAEIVNLRRWRKQKVRTQADGQAAQNRVTFGRTKPEKTHLEALKVQSERRLDGHALKDKPDNHA